VTTETGTLVLAAEAVAPRLFIGEPSLLSRKTPRHTHRIRPLVES
jgi:hypothetical protein